MLASFSRPVMPAEGRTRLLHPGTQIVRSIVDGVTAGLIAPGVQRESGSEKSPDPPAWQLPAGG
jgi:hypothetical protein